MFGNLFSVNVNVNTNVKPVNKLITPPVINKLNSSLECTPRLTKYPVIYEIVERNHGRSAQKIVRIDSITLTPLKMLNTAKKLRKAYKSRNPKP